MFEDYVILKHAMLSGEVLWDSRTKQRVVITEMVTQQCPSFDIRVRITPVRMFGIKDRSYMYECNENMQILTGRFNEWFDRDPSDLDMGDFGVLKILKIV